MAANTVPVVEQQAPENPRSWWQGLERHDISAHAAHPWYLVIWLTGVDYFSTLGYQPGIALLAAGALSPVATAVLVAVTLLCALPIYWQVAGRSFVGQGSIAMLENLLPGWWGRILVLILLGFAATDFVITMTLSAADAATHATQNPFLHKFVGNANMTITLVLLALLAAVFLKGFKEAIELATAVCIPYLVLNVVVLARAMLEVVRHPVAMPHWREALHTQGDWTHLALAAVILFPRLALGLSGFETGVSVMPLIVGSDEDAKQEKPAGRIQNTRKLLLSAAAIMSVLLMISSFVSTLLIPKEAYREGGPASGRALAYLAHAYLGNIFGSLYDISTILILWFAGASAMAGLLHLVPRYLPRIGLAPHWVAYARPLVVVLFVFNVLITVIFKANVEAQGGAYATGVLVLMSSAAVAASISLWKERSRLLSAYCWAVVLVFTYTTISNIIQRTDGIIIASFFILFLVIVSGVSRYWRATELRAEGYRFCNPESEELFKSLQDQRINMVPIRTLSPEMRADRVQKISTYYNVQGPLTFVHIKLLDNRSEFSSSIEISVTEEDGQYLLTASQATAFANAVAYLTRLLHPAAIFLGLSRQNLMRQSFRYFFLGEGETGVMVYAVLQRYWEATKDDTERPRIFLMSD
ncbi:MAG: hypothetical protein ACR2NN_06840 [Bryobacteraceae bacterium]